MKYDKAPLELAHAPGSSLIGARSARLALALLLALGCEAPAETGPADAAARDAGSADASTLPRDGGPPGSLPDAGRVVDGGPNAADAGPSPTADAGPRADAGPDVSLRLPPPDGQLDYQLGGPYSPPSGVTVVSRDRSASPAPGVYSICYVNGFQTQPDERAFWTNEHPELLLRDGDGDPVIDPDWDEILLDVTTASKREALAAIVGGWIDGCAADGFDALEIDNLDTYARSGGRIDQSDAVAFMRMLADRAHAVGLAVAQKNSAEILDQRAALGTDFAVVEECNRWRECDDFTDVYGDQVYVIEYRRQDFERGCSQFPGLSIVLRDLDLRPAGSGGYVYDDC